MADTAVFSDAFAYTDGALVGKGTPAWVGFTGGTSLAVASGAVRGVNGRYAARPSASAQDSYTKADFMFSDLSNAGSSVRLYLRLTGVDTLTRKAVFAQVLANGSATILAYFADAGVLQTLATAAAGSIALSANVYQPIRLQATGGATTTVTLSVGDDFTLTAVDADSNLNFSGTSGLFTGGSSTTAGRYIDNFEWGTYAADGTTVPIHLLRTNYYPAFT